MKPSRCEIELLDSLNVSRETLANLEQFVSILKTWNARINLISRQTIDDIWARHIVDCAQIVPYLPGNNITVLDVGSGSGLPGAITAIITQEDTSMRHVWIESDTRKCAFLHHIVTKLKLSVQVINNRIEEVEPQNADILTGRALAPLTDMLAFGDQHLRPDGTALLHKGQTYRAEIEDAKQHWNFVVNPYRSITNPDAAILEITEIKCRENEQIP